MFLINEVVLCDKPLSEELVLDAGVFCVLGENEQAKDEHLSIAARASQSDQIFREADEEEAAFTKPPWGELALLILREPKKDMQEVLDRKAFCRNPSKCTCARNVQTGHEGSESSSSKTDE
jgi:hypothetical protein